MYKKIIRYIKKIVDLCYLILFGRVRYARYKGVTVGSSTRIYITDWGSEPFLISVGSNVTITGGVKILTHDGASCLVVDQDGMRYQKYGAVTIGDNVFVGAGSIIMPGITVESNCIIGAGSVVTRSVSSGSVVAGNPARIICSFDDYCSRVRERELRADSFPDEQNFAERVRSFVSGRKK